MSQAIRGQAAILFFQSTPGSSGGWVVKLFACRARGPGLDSSPHHLIFRDWLSPASKSRYSWNTAKATLILNTTNRPEKHKLDGGRWDLAYCQVLLNSLQQFQRRSRKCLGQSEGRAFFRSAQKHKLGRRRWDLASCQFSLNSVQRFQKRSRKCESLWRTDDALWQWWAKKCFTVF